MLIMKVSAHEYTFMFPFYFQGLYQLLIECLSKIESQYLMQVLETLTSLTNGYPDLLDKSGLDFMIA